MRLFLLLSALGSALLAAGAGLVTRSAWAPPVLPEWAGYPALYAGSAGICLAAAYFAGLAHREPGLFFLSGRVGRWIWRYVQVPYLLAAIPIVIVSRLVLRERLLDRVADRLHVGGAPLAGQRDAVLAHGVDAVLNLCVEFGDFARLGPVPGLEYRREGWLDGAAPTVAQLDRAARWIEERHRAGRTVLVHCAQGHGRSGLAAAAAMIRLGLASDPDDACRRLAAARPGVRLHGAQRRCLDRWWTAATETELRGEAGV